VCFCFRRPASSVPDRSSSPGPDPVFCIVNTAEQAPHPLKPRDFFIDRVVSQSFPFKILFLQGNPMQISDEALAPIKSFEAFRAFVYKRMLRGYLQLATVTS
jgi:hypothetical protein